MDDAITVTVPASTDFVHILRTVVAGVAARMNLTVDAIDDLRLLVDEAASVLLSRRVRTEHLRVRIEPGADQLRVVTSSAPADAASLPARLQETLAWQVLSALADDVQLTTEDGSPGIAFAKRVQPQSRRE